MASMANIFQAYDATQKFYGFIDNFLENFNFSQ